MKPPLVAATLVVCLFVGALALADAQSRGGGSGPPSPLLSIARTGAVLHSPGVTAIFWGPEWSDPAFADDIVNGLDTLLSGYSGSEYAGTTTEYYDKRGSISAFAPYLGHLMDASAPAPPGGLTGAVAIAEACRITNNQPDPEDVYIVYTSTNTGALEGKYCGLHAWGACGSGKNAVPIQAIGVPYTTGNDTCRGVQDFETGHSLALGQMANLTMHELAETITDPRGTGWRDGNGDEISDKCLKIFPSSLSAYPFFGGSYWKLQPQWSNAAYLSGSGALNQLGQPGCRW